MSDGAVAIVLHAHLPFVHHPEQEGLLEERWLFDALTDCYLPLIGMLDRLEEDGVRFSLTLSLSPTLVTMFQSELLQQRYLAHLQQLAKLAQSELKRTRLQCSDYHPLAFFYQQRIDQALTIWQQRCDGNILTAFTHHFQTGNIELITSAATHGFLPLLNHNPSAVKAQLMIGADLFEATFGQRPDGFWLPECAYYPGLEHLVREAGGRYFFTDSHAILNASERPQCGVHAPLDCGNGVAALGRDPDCSRQVWSATEGYPGDPEYREYYSDIGFDLPLEDIGAWLPGGDIRVSTGFKYHRITGGDAPKVLYDPVAATERAQNHASDFLQRRQRQLAVLKTQTESRPIIVAPYDAELFGHWWFEGPLWLESLIRQAVNTPGLEITGCGTHLDRCDRLQSATPSASSWGQQGYNRYWLNESNEWIYPHLHHACRQMEQLAADYPWQVVDALTQRAVRQAARSLLLAQASDWPFIMKSATMVEYAVNSVKDHLARFNYLYDSIINDQIDLEYLTALETMDAIFPDLNYGYYSGVESVTEK